MIHKFASAKADGGDATLVLPSAWNDTHVHGVRAISANTAGIATDDFVKATGGGGGINYTLPPPARTGQPIIVQKVDSGAGAITILPNAAEKINSQGVLNGNSYVLQSAGQSVRLISDGTNWWAN